MRTIRRIPTTLAAVALAFGLASGPALADDDDDDDDDGGSSLEQRVEHLERALEELTTPPPTEVRVNCNAGDSLQDAVDAAPPGQTIFVSGTCREHVMVMTDKVSIIGYPSASIDAPTEKSPALDVEGAQGVRLKKLDLLNGLNGLRARRGADVVASNLVARGNAEDGIKIDETSTAEVADILAEQNGRSGIEALRSSSLTVSGLISANSNGRFGPRP